MKLIELDDRVLKTKMNELSSKIGTRVNQNRLVNIDKISGAIRSTGKTYLLTSFQYETKSIKRAIGI